jgi:hypothetical protein
MCDEYGVGLNECKLLCRLPKWDKSYHLLHISEVASPLQIPYKQIILALSSSEGRYSVSGKMFSEKVHITFFSKG